MGRKAKDADIIKLWVDAVEEAAGTGNGGAGDWQGRILKYRDHGLEKTEMLPKGEIDIEARVMQEAQENTYSVYFPELGGTAVFESREVFHERREGRQAAI